MKLQKLSDEAKAETKYCPFRLEYKETKIEAHEGKIQENVLFLVFFCLKAAKNVCCYLNIIFLILL